MPATYAINGRQFIVVPVAAGTGLFAARFGASFDSPRGGLAQDKPFDSPRGGLAQGKPSDSPRGALAQGAPGVAGGRGGASVLAGQYIVLALKR
jgi:hypothetical protein